jgi:hypothetical protein
MIATIAEIEQFLQGFSFHVAEHPMKYPYKKEKK